MTKVTEKDKAEFRQYLVQCTDNQVRGVYEKEQKANRRTYMTLAKQEADKRGIAI